MLDFMKLKQCSIYGGKKLYLKPYFKSNTKVCDIMTRGNGFYAIWDFENECWSQNIDRAYELIDASIREYVAARKEVDGDNCFNGIEILYAEDSDSGVTDSFIKYISQRGQQFTPLNTKVVFKSDKASRELYSSMRLPYDPLDVPTPNYDELMSVIYSDEERQKIEWLVGAALCGDNDKIQKFGVFYGDPGTGKGTVLDIISWLFGKTKKDRGYTTYFEASALGKSADQFALEPFKNNPVIAIQADGNLSRIEDNSRLNTLIAHEPLVMNEKNTKRYITKFDTILFMASNSPVKITDAKSGLLRRLIDIRPSGKIIDGKKFKELKSKIKFELSGIAYQCMELYSNNKSLYDDYRPMDMMAKTNDFYDFVLEYYDRFLMEDYVTLATTWEWYKKYAEDSSLTFKLQRRQFALELSSYFESGPLDEWSIDEDGTRRHVSSVYRGFKKEKFKNVKSVVTEVVRVKKSGQDEKTDHVDIPDWLKLHEVADVEEIEQNPFNVYFNDGIAQYAVIDESGKGSRPKRKWDDVRAKLRSINTTKEHYILTQTVCSKFVVVDFDLKDDDGKKSLKKNLEAAAAFPKTYAETSKSGEGLHLHYIYDGDVNELSMLYDTDIEIKVFKGNSALRRRLSLCNNEEIAHLSSGLPLKEVKHKVIDLNRIENEKHLRACIMKALQKKVHANTRPNVDYIKHVTDIAYESGISYDISDLMSRIFNFASMSTNQSQYCMNVVSDLHVCSPDRENRETPENFESDEYLGKPIAFYDIEIYPNLFVLCYKIEGGIIGDEGKKEVIKLINPTANEVSNFVNSYRIIGFNNLNYDNIILYARILGYTNEELYRLSHSMINDEDSKIPFNKYEASKLSYTDVYDFSTKKQSLKKWEIELGIHHQEMYLEWDQPAPKKYWDDIADYCANDVVATEAVFYHLKTDWKARQILADLAGMTVNDPTNRLTLRIVFGKERHPHLIYTDLATGKQIETIGGEPMNKSKPRWEVT